MTVYFDRFAPFFLLAEGTFDGIEVTVPAEFEWFCHEMNSLLEEIKQDIQVAGAPEVSNQELADKFVNGLTDIIEGFNNDKEK